MLHLCFIWLCLNLFKESSGQITVTQTPASFHSNPGDSVTIQCKTSSNANSYMALYKFTTGQNPKLLIYGASTLYGDTPNRFSGTGRGTDFSFSINGLHPEDGGVYYCGQYQSYPLTFGGGTKVEINRGKDASPSAVIYPPSEEQLKTSSVTIVCLVDGFYPGELNVEWKMDGTVITEGAQTSSAAQNADKTYRLSSMLSLPKETYNSHELYVCEVKHKTLAQPLVKSFKRSECS